MRLKKGSLLKANGGVPSPNPARRRKLHIPRPAEIGRAHSFCTKTRLLLRKTTEAVVKQRD